jgi:hypothetical protein
MTQNVFEYVDFTALHLFDFIFQAVGHVVIYLFGNVLTLSVHTLADVTL